ncbi:hypothetical protein ACFPM0_19865 [Pseudonocardia sulfidoxydans]
MCRLTRSRPDECGAVNRRRVTTTEGVAAIVTGSGTSAPWSWLR